MDSSCPSNLCRICLSDGALIPIFGSKVNEYEDICAKLRLCLGEKVPDLMGYPRNICEECHQTLNETISFIKKYKETNQILEKKLEEIVNTSSISIEPEVKIEEIEGKVKVEIQSDKYEPKISFDNAEQFKDQVKPLIKKEQEKIQTKPTVKRNLRSKKGKVLGNTKVVSLKEYIENEVFKKSQVVRKKKKKESPAVPSLKEYIEKEVLKKSQFIQKKKDLETSSQTEPKLCDTCGDSFNTQKLLQNHVFRFHTEKTPLQCPQCSQTYTVKTSLQSHIKRRHTGKNSVCTACGKAFSGQGQLGAHYRFVHLKVPRKKAQCPCKTCGKIFSSAKCLLMHVRSVHTGERPAVCTVCDSRFIHDDHLRDHMRLHTGETPFKCPVCNRGYAQRCNMKSHIKHNHRISQLNEITLKTIHPRYLRLMKP